MSYLHHAGDTINEKYKILEVIGRGGSGITYKAIALATETEVAIKVLSLQQIDDWKQVELFEREAKILANLDHPAIPKYVDYFCLDRDSSRDFYLVQQLAQGKSLFQLVQDGWRTNEVEIKSIAQQILEILIYLHGLVPPVIHRDLKPQNIIRSDDGKIHLVDFGAVQNSYYTNFKQGSTVVGTYGYMAPEQFHAQAISATDLYSLGATIVYLLTHYSPAELPHSNLKIQYRDRVKISDSFATWIDKLIEPNLSDRFESANLALKELDDVTFQTRESVRKLLQTRFSLVTVSLLASLGLAGVGFAYSLQPKENVAAELEKNPAQICQSLELAKYYLKKGGDPNLVVSYTSKSRYNRNQQQEDSLLFCILKETNQQDRELVSVIKLLIEKEANLKVDTAQGFTPLQWLLSNKNKANRIGKEARIKIANLLIDHGADLENSSTRSLFPLILALESKLPDIAEKLINSGVDINHVTQNGKTSLMIAIEKNYFQLAQQLISKGAKINVADSYTNTPLSIAIKKKNIELVKLLIAKGADIYITDKQGNSLLFHAVATGNLELVNLLLAKKVDIKVLNNKGQTVLFGLFTRDYKSRRTYNASIYNSSIVEKLLTKGLDVNAQDKEGKTVLHYTVNISAIQHLINLKANVNITDNDGTTPLLLAINNRKWQAVKILLDNGAEINSTSRFAPFALTSAIKNKRIDILKFLLENKVDPNQKDNYGNSPLFDAVSYNISNNTSLKAIELLLKYGADVNAQGKGGGTALSLIVSKSTNRYGYSKHSDRHLQIIRLLISNGADVNHRDKQGRSILVKAAYSGNQELVELLQEKGAKY